MKEKSIGQKASNWFVIALKSTKFLKALKALKAVKAMKPMIALGSMVLSLFVYGAAFGWIFGIGLIVMLFVHEMGHVIALRMKGYPTKAPVFIPMLGAVIFAPAKMNRENEAFIGIGGPVLGTVGALVAWVVWAIHPNHPVIWLLMSFLGIVINLFNMVPLRPLDGGRITQAVGSWFNWVGILMLLAITLAMKDPGLLLIWIIVIYDIDKVSFKKRFSLSVTVYVVMFIAIISGLGEGEKWVYWLDFGFATFYLFVIAGMFSLSQEELEQLEVEMKENSGSDRKHLEMKDKMSWLGKYAVMLMILIVVLVFQSKQIAPWLEEQEQKIENVQPPIGSNVEKGLLYMEDLSFFSN